MKIVSCVYSVAYIRKLKFNNSNADERIATCRPAGRRNDDAMKTEAGIKKLITKN
jgi:hypothetical protein